ncbi:MAG: UbiA family prenyltransferase [Candidatus Moranbacteria bacterium]|nr:UbiA family prenyltransferase [Candidatus Moranbacteria bacterium]
MKKISAVTSLFRNIRRIMSDAVETIESAPFSLGSFSLSFTALIVIRLLVESGVSGFRTEGLAFLFFGFSHTFLFFLFAFLLFLPIARIAGATSWQRAVNLILFGFLVVLTPPIVDKIIFGDRMFWSFYELDGLYGLISRFFHFFGDTPDIGMTYGARAEVAIMSVGLGLYAWFRSRKATKALGVSLLSYAVFFILGTFPSYVAIVALAPSQGILGVTELNVAGFTLSPKSFLGHEMADPRTALGIRMSIIYALLVSVTVGVFLYRVSKKTFLALIRNVRWPQIFWHGGLLLLGGGLAALYAGARLRFDFFETLGVLLLAGAVESAWLASVVFNDIADRRIDEKTNRDRPLPARTISATLYREIGILFFAASILFAGIVSMKAMLLILTYQAIAFLYSSPPFRLKRFPIIATVLSAAAGMSVILAGFSAVSQSSDISPVPATILAFLAIAYAVTIPLKDFKDIEGDRKDGVFTVPVILGTEKARAVIGTALFLCYVASPIVLHEPKLAIPSILFGTLSFLSVARAGRKQNKRETFRALPAWNMLIITVYGLIATIVLLT